MKRSVFFVFALVLISSFACASPNIDVEKVDMGSVVISELKNPAVYNLIIDNREAPDNFEIYSLVGVSMSPKGTFELPMGKTTVPVRAYLSSDLLQRSGYISFEYQLRGQQVGIYADTMRVKIVPLKDVFEVSARNVAIDDSSALIIVRNVQNTNIEDVKLRFRSDFFDEETEASFNPYEERNISVKLNKERMKDLTAGDYDLFADIGVEGQEVTESGRLKYVEGESISTTKEGDGFIVRKVTITKSNNGNIPATIGIEMSKDILSRLFSIYSVEPTSIERKGLLVLYKWDKKINPGESFEVVSSTNYTFPFIALIAVILIVFFARRYSMGVISLKKRVSFVKTRGGEFALRVTVSAKARKHVDGVQIIDTLPGVTKLYEHFGRKPDRIDEKSRRLFWNVGSMNSGEERVFSYIIYSKIRFVGRFELPSATAVFSINGKTEESWSNKAYFVSETAIENN